MRIYDKDEIEELNAEPWQIELLHLNPSYVCWGPHEDYMYKEPGKGWDAPVFVDSWKKFDWDLDDLNECVNFYFEVVRDSEECSQCRGTGYNEQTKKIADSFYGYGPDDPEKWIYNITQDEVDALWGHNRLKGSFNEKPTPEQVNEWAKKGLGHDGINRWILIEVRAKRLGVYGTCPNCNGGSVYTVPNAHVNLVLWMLHPRKGCSRGVEIKNIQQDDVPSIMKFLKEAADRNAQRFKSIGELSRVLESPKGHVALEIDVKNECAKAYLARRLKHE